MFKPYKAILASLILLSLAGMTVIQVKAQDGPVESEILPSQGNANTTILARFRTTNATIGNVDKADIFWDDSNVALNQQGILGADGSYNYNVTVPTQPPFSDIGNHTIRVDTFIFNHGQASFNFTFTITEFVPSPEYLALNATYTSLLTNFTNLLNNYNQLLQNYSQTSADYAALLADHEQLLLDYNSISANVNSLTANYNSLSANYNSQLTNYNGLHQVFNSLLTNYTSLQRNLESLSSNYNSLTQDYNSLNSSYDNLRTNYDAAIGQLAFNRNLTYILTASTIILAVTSIYFATKKPNPALKTRY